MLDCPCAFKESRLIELFRLDLWPDDICINIKQIKAVILCLQNHVFLFQTTKLFKSFGNEVLDVYGILQRIQFQNSSNLRTISEKLSTSYIGIFLQNCAVQSGIVFCKCLKYFFWVFLENVSIHASKLPIQDQHISWKSFTPTGFVS